MKNQERPPVSVLPCPECKVGSAVNKSEVFHAFHSKKYFKRRKARKSAAQKKAPQVGKDTNIEYALTDPSFVEQVRPPKLFYGDEDDDFLPRILIWGAAIITFPVVIAYSFDISLWKIGFVIFAILTGLLLIKLENARLRKNLARQRRYELTWLCLTCGYQWVESAQDSPRRARDG
jgi:hypothetical protein